MFNKLLRLFLFLIFAAPASAATVMVLGDSLSAGYGLKAGEGWVSLLQKELGTKHKVVNASISGETSAGGLTRLPALLKQHRPQVVVVELGGNDGLRGLPVAQVRANLARIIEQSRKAGAKVLLVGIALPPNYGKPYTEQFQRAYSDLARQYQLALVPLLIKGFEADRASFQADGIHPVAKVQGRMMQTVKAPLLPLLK